MVDHKKSGKTEQCLTLALLMKENSFTFDDEEIIIRLKPEILEGHGWTGDLSINFEVFDNNPLNNEQYLAVFKLAKMNTCISAHLNTSQIELQSTFFKFKIRSPFSPFPAARQL